MSPGRPRRYGNFSDKLSQPAIGKAAPGLFDARSLLADALKPFCGCDARWPFCVGTVNMDRLRINPEAHRIMHEFMEAKKVVACICHGPWLLVNAGVAEGKTP